VNNEHLNSSSESFIEKKSNTINFQQKYFTYILKEKREELYILSLALHFSTIFVHNIKENYVLCDLCVSLIAYKHATGTGGM
jgi:hypothetical protein